MCRVNSLLPRGFAISPLLCPICQYLGRRLAVAVMSGKLSFSLFVTCRIFLLIHPFSMGLGHYDVEIKAVGIWIRRRCCKLICDLQVDRSIPFIWLGRRGSGRRSGRMMSGVMSHADDYTELGVVRNVHGMEHLVGNAGGFALCIVRAA
ncbi:hypothetical protein Tco_1378237 [Tanacetum coccineum]